MKPLISIILPIYKVEKYLSRCIDSIICQSYEKIEIILVDDGSPDNCPQICDNYANNDSRIRVIHKQNGGLSDARNAGISVATGDFVAFIDSDDFVSSDYIESLYDTIVKTRCDIVECDIVRCGDDFVDDYSDDLNITVYEKEEALYNLIIEKEFHQYVWNKLYKMSVIKDIPFIKGKLHEDDFWTYLIFGKTKKVAKLNKTLYFYYQRKDSIVGANYNVRRLDELEARNEMLKYIHENFPKLIEAAKVKFFFSCLYSYQCTIMYMDKSDKANAKKLINKYYRGWKLDFKNCKNLNLINKCWVLIANISLNLCSHIRCFLKIGL